MYTLTNVSVKKFGFPSFSITIASLPLLSVIKTDGSIERTTAT